VTSTRFDVDEIQGIRDAAAADWKVPSSVQPKAQDYTYDLERALSAVVAVHTIVPADAFSRRRLPERAGNGRPDPRRRCRLTIGYLITEA